MDIQIDLNTLRPVFLPYINSLRDFHFSYRNPVFWLFLLIVCLILLRFWQPKKTISFCLTIAVILLAATKIERIMAQALARQGGVFDPFIIRIMLFIVVSIVGIYFVFIDNS